MYTVQYMYKPNIAGLSSQTRQIPNHLIAEILLAYQYHADLFTIKCHKFICKSLKKKEKFDVLLKPRKYVPKYVTQ